MDVIENDDLSILNEATKYLVRDHADARHNFGQYDNNDPRGRLCEPWRFPIIQSYAKKDDGKIGDAFNTVTFVADFRGRPAPENLSVIGTFDRLYQPIPLQPVQFLNEPTGFYAVTVVIPKGEAYQYKYLINGVPQLDPINPQQAMLDNGERWSRFFTHLCTTPLVLTSHEMTLLTRLTDPILPFRTPEGERFLSNFYNGLDQQSKQTQYAHAYRLDQSVGVCNFIDKLLAKEESHHLKDYQICLRLIDRCLRQRNPYVEPDAMSKELYIELYNEMATDQVTGWDHNQYQSPQYFLALLRRHTYTGAFSHPKYGGNTGAVGWAYLSERFRDRNGHTLFDWRRAVEKPLGTHPVYRG